MSDTNTTDQSTTEGRDANGRFAIGNKHGTGNPFARDVARLRKRALDLMTDEAWDGIFQAMIKKAQDGDVNAAKFIVSYCIGKPPAEVHPDKLDFDEWEIYRRQAEIAKDTPALMPFPNSEFSVNALRGVRPEVTMAMRDELMEKAYAQDAEEAKQAEAARKRKEKREARKLQAEQEGMEVSAKRQATVTAQDLGVGDAVDPQDICIASLQHPPSANGSIGACSPSANGDTVDAEAMARFLDLLEREGFELPPEDLR